MEEEDLAQHARLFIPSNMIPLRQHIPIDDHQRHASIRRQATPLVPGLSGHRLARRDADQHDVEEMRDRDRRRSVEQVRHGVLGVAKRTVGQHGAAVLVVEQPGGLAFEFFFDDGVSRCLASQLPEAREEQPGRGGRLGAREREDVLWREARGCVEREEHGSDGEQRDGEEREGGERDDGLALRAGLRFGTAIPAYGFRDENGPEEDDEGLDPVVWMLADAWLDGWDEYTTYVPHDIAAMAADCQRECGVQNKKAKSS